jgi:hypothetical protein
VVLDSHELGCLKGHSDRSKRVIGGSFFSVFSLAPQG